MPLRTLLAGALLAALPLLAQDKSLERGLDTRRSTITTHVGKSWLLSGAAHDHTINAPISSGTVRESTAPHIEFTIETAKMTVKPDPRIDPKDQATIQTHME